MHHPQTYPQSHISEIEQEQWHKGFFTLWVIRAAISCLFQKSSWNGWSRSGQMNPQKDIWMGKQTDWQVTNKDLKYFFYDPSSFCSSNYSYWKENYLKKWQLLKKMWWKKNFSYSYEYLRYFKLLLRTNYLTKTLEILIQKTSNNMLQEEKKKKSWC